MALSWLTNSYESVKAEVLRQLKRSEREDLFKAVIAGCALMAYADGRFSQPEKASMLDLIRTTEAIDMFDTDDALAEFDRISELYYFDFVDGEAHAMRRLVQLRDRREDAIVVAKACAVIATADGHFDEDEKATLRRICKLMNLDPAEVVA